MVETSSQGADLPRLLRQLCSLAVETVPCAGASVTLASSDGATQLLCATDGVSRELADLQFALGDGPALSALHLSRPILLARIDEVADDAGLNHEVVAAARRAGVGAIFAFPLKIGAVRLGVFELYRSAAGELSQSGFDRALRLADAVTHTMLSVAETDVSAPTGAAGSSVFDGDGHSLGRAETRAVVHQATGMLMVQLGVPIDVAFARLRAHAYAADAGIIEVAESIVARELRLEHDDGAPGSGGDGSHEED